MELILIPAMSANVEPFNAIANSQAVFAGGSTLVANLDSESAAVIGHPQMAAVKPTAGWPAGDEGGSSERGSRFVVSILRKGSPLLTIAEPDDSGTVTPRWVAI